MPFQASSGLGGRGVYLGRDATGGAFCFDPFDLYERGILTGPAMVVLGEIGRGKSAFVKAYLHRQCGVFGRPAVVVSPSAANTTSSPMRSASNRSDSAPAARSSSTRCKVEAARSRSSSARCAASPPRRSPAP